MVKLLKNVVAVAVIFAASAGVTAGAMWMTGTVVMPFLFGIFTAIGLGQVLLSD